MNSQQPKQRLWIISGLYYPELHATGGYMTQIAEGLTDDFDVSVICSQPAYLGRGTKATSSEIRNKVHIFRVWSTTFDRRNLLLRFVNVVTLGLFTFLKALNSFKKGDLVLAVSSPPSSALITCIASLIKGSRYTLLVHDAYPEVLSAVGLMREGSFVFSTIEFINRWIFKYASKIIVVGRDMQERYIEKTNGLDVPVVYIPNWGDVENIEPTDRLKNPLLDELGISDKFVVLYAGNLGRPNDVETVIAAADKLRDHPSVHFLFIGSGAKQKWLERSLVDLDLSNVAYIGQRPASEQEIFLNACDIAVVSLINKMWGVAVPSRTYNILAVGKPILGLIDKDSEVARMVIEDHLGIQTDPGDTDGLVSAILEMESKKNDLGQTGKNARRVAVEKYSHDIGIGRYKYEMSQLKGN